MALTMEEDPTLKTLSSLFKVQKKKIQLKNQTEPTNQPTKLPPPKQKYKQKKKLIFKV